MDGWGLSPSWAGNAIMMNNPPNISSYWRIYPHKVLNSYAQDSRSNTIITDSRYAHETISAGRNIPQDREYIDEEIENHNFYRNQTLKAAFDFAKKNDSNVHYIGLLSDSKIHSKIEHLLALIEFANRNNFKRLFLDLIIDGENSTQCLKLIDQIRTKIAETGCGQFSSVTGRNYAMANERNLENIADTNLMLTEAKAPHADSIEEAIKHSQEKCFKNADIKPTLIKNNDGIVTIKANDSVIFFNFRADKIGTLTRTFIDPNLKLPFWKPNIINNIQITTFTRYFKSLNTQVAFERPPLSDILPELLAKFQKSDLRITETVKKSHVTTFFNGGREDKFSLEERKILPSIKNNLNPEMSGTQITLESIKAIKSLKYDFILINFPNADTIAHTGNIRATGQAILAVDRYVGQIADACMSVGGAVLITADHGIAEEMRQKSGHSFNPVPFIFIAKDKKRDLLQGALAIPSSTLSKIIGAKENLTDITPTILEMLNIPKPEAMTGHSLLGKLE